jgi:hypothetical protein
MQVPARANMLRASRQMVLIDRNFAPLRRE